MGPSCAPPRPSCAPPLPLFNFITPKRGGTVPPNKNCGGTSHLVPPAQTPRPTCSKTQSFNVVGWSHLVPPVCKSLVFMWWGDPSSSHLLKTFQFSCGGAIPRRPTCLKPSSFHVVGRSRLAPPAQKPFHVVGRSRLVPPAQNLLVFMWWEDPTSPHLFENL